MQERDEASEQVKQVGERLGRVRGEQKAIVDARNKHEKKCVCCHPQPLHVTTGCRVWSPSVMQHVDAFEDYVIISVSSRHCRGPA